MKFILYGIITSLFLVPNSNSKELTEQDIQEVYVLGLTQFLQTPIIHHKKDKKQLIVMTNENISEPNKINRIKIAWVTDGVKPTSIMHGKAEKHNGRSIITMSHKVDGNGIVKLSIYQWYIKDAERKNYTLVPLETNSEENGYVKNSYLVSRTEKGWKLE